MKTMKNIARLSIEMKYVFAVCALIAFLGIATKARDRNLVFLDLWLYLKEQAIVCFNQVMM